MITPGRPPQNYSPNINGFRGVCVLLVFLHHVANSGLPPAPDQTSAWQPLLHALFMSFGYGVELFFMISGYVIVQSLRRHATIAAFLLDRVLRIFPVWVPVALFLFVARGLVGGNFAPDALTGWLVFSAANLLLLPPILPMSLLHPASWSLTYEWVFYIISALAALIWRSPRSLPAAKMLWCLTVVLLLCCYPRALFFLPGVLVALAPSVVKPLQRLPLLVYPALPIFLMTWYSTGIFAAQYKIPLWSSIAEGHGVAIVVALVAATQIIACVAVTGIAPGLPALRSRVAQQLGTISYSFYLVHPIVMSAEKQLLLKVMPTAPGNLLVLSIFSIVALATCWLLSYLSWRWLEQSLGKWLKSQIGKRRAKAVEIPAKLHSPQ
jgi:peptidoglycan/LPS O-acetylase OafA/YrhL